MSGRRLIIQADDLGASPSITNGILAAHEQGSVTQSSLIVPAPDATRAATLARAAALPLGIHLAVICEWENVRWGPITTAPSLCGEDGAFWPGVPEAKKAYVRSELLAELRAQVAKAKDIGVEVSHLDSHVGVVDAQVLSLLAEETSLACRDEIPPPGATLELDSLWHLSVIPYREKINVLVDYVAGLTDGVHMIVCHPATDGPDLYELCSRGSRRWKWAVDIRLSDLDALTDPRFLGACKANKIDLTSVPIISAEAGAGRPRTHDTVEIDGANS